MFNVRPIWEMAAHLAVAGDVFDCVLFCAVFFFSTKCLDGICFPTYSCYLTTD